MTAPQDKKCRICLSALSPYPMGEKNGHALIACQSCGSVMADPWVEQAEIDRFFGDVQPEIVHIADPLAQIAAVKKQIRQFVPNPAGKSFLDISCRQGYAVMAAKELGMQAKGIDPHDFFIAFAKDKYDAELFEHVSVPEYAAKQQQADVVFSLESICEQPDPDGYVAAVAKLMAPGGVMYLHEPDGNHFMLPRNFSRWVFADPPLNFIYPSEKGLRAMLARHGLKVRKKYFTWSPFMRFIVVKKQ